MDHFRFEDDRLWCEGVPLTALAEAHGTPLYVYSQQTIRDHVSRLREAFAEADPLICYAVKANSNLAILSLLRELGTGFDIVSGGELGRAMQVGADPQTVVFSGVAKSDEEMAAALDAGILMFNVESQAELAALARVAEAKGTVAPVALRVNPDVDPKTHRYITTGKKASKFGIDLEVGEELAAQVMAHDHLELLGIQCHIGSQIGSVAPYKQSVERTAALARRLADRCTTLRWLNMGGGYGIYYRDKDVPALSEYAEAVLPVVAETGLGLIMEPGRVIVGNAGVLLTEVRFNKRAGDRRFVIVDAGMNDLIRPSLYEGYHRIWPAVGSPPPELGTEADAEVCDIVGPVCESGDFLAKDRPLPVVQEGDLLAVMSAGAYGFTMASNYNERRRAAEVLVRGDAWRVVRRRETYEDLVRCEAIEAAWRRAEETPHG